MNRVFQKNWNSRFGNYLLPLFFCIGNLANFFFFYMGLAYEENIVRKIGFIIINVFYAITAFAALLSALRFGKMRLRLLLPLIAVVLLYAGYYLTSLIRFGCSTSWIYNTEQFVTFSFPAFCAGIYAACRKNEESLFDCLEHLSVWTVPAALVYLNGALFNCNPFGNGRDLGIINYMSVAYTLMPFLLAVILQFLDNKPLTLFGRTWKHPQWVRGALIALFWVVLIASGTRGSYFCVVGFCVCVVFSAFIHRRNRKKSVILSTAMVLLLCFNIFIYSPKGFNTDRMQFFIDGLGKGEIVTSEKDDELDSKLEELVKSDGNQQVANGDSSNGNESPKITDRGTLYKLAWMEFQKNPLTGMGSMGYAVKYGMYPHNAVLQILCETGVVGAALFMTMILWAFIRILRSGQKRKEVRFFLLFLIAYAIEANISGDFWNCPVLLCALGYGFALSMTKELS